MSGREESEQTYSVCVQSDIVDIHTGYQDGDQEEVLTSWGGVDE